MIKVSKQIDNIKIKLDDIQNPQIKNILQQYPNENDLDAKLKYIIFSRFHEITKILTDTKFQKVFIFIFIF